MTVYTIDSGRIVAHLNVIYKYADSWLDSQYSQSTACKKRCSICCNWAIRISYSEAFGLVDYLNTVQDFNFDAFDKNMEESFDKCNSIPADYSCVTPANETETKIVLQNIDKQLGPCPFLINAECSVYLMRPLICRFWISSSLLTCQTEAIDPAMKSSIHNMSFNHHYGELHKIEMLVINILKSNGALRFEFDPLILIGNRITKFSDGYALKLPGEVYVGTRRK